MGRRMKRAPPVSTTRPADAQAVDRTTCGRECCPSSGLDAGMSSIRVRPGIEAVSRFASVGLQVFAPKCALCWTTYAGLVNASWFVATNVHPVWASLAALTSTLSVCVSLRAARRTRHHQAWLWTTAAWSCLVVGWLLDCLPVRYLGFGLLVARFTWVGLSGRARARTLAGSQPGSP